MHCAAPVAGSLPYTPAPAPTGAGSRFKRSAVCAAAAGVLAACLLFPAAVRAAPPAQSWIKPKADESALVDIARAGDRWVVVGERGHVLVSDDAATWRQVRVPTRVMLTASAFNAEGLGFAVGHEATIIRTRDFGETWERVYHAPDEQAPLLDVVMPGGDRVVAVGAYGMIAESGDAGETWAQRILEPEDLEPAASADEEEFYYDYHLNDVAIAGDGRWYIAAEAGNVYRSDDAGGSWTRLPSPYEGSFFGVLPLGGGRVLLFGLRGSLFHSVDAGASWQAIDTGTDATLTAGVRLPGGRALIAGHAGIVLSGIAPGADPARGRLTNRPAVADAYRLDNGDLLTVGEAGIQRWPEDSVH